MLTARGPLHDDDDDDDAGPLNCSVQSLQPAPASAESASRRPVVHEISPRIFVASVQFQRPFDYRSSLAVAASIHFSFSAR